MDDCRGQVNPGFQNPGFQKFIDAVPPGARMTVFILGSNLNLCSRRRTRINHVRLVIALAVAASIGAGYRDSSSGKAGDSNPNRDHILPDVDAVRIGRSETPMFRLITILLCVLFSAAGAFPQIAPESRGRAERERVVRTNANAALDSVIDQLPYVENLRDRLAIAENVVKLLARSRPDRCRKILDLLFDKTSEAQKDRATNGNGEGPDPDAIMERIVQLATLFDPELAEKYADKYSATDDSAGSNQGSNRNNAQAASLRLKIALELADRDPAASLAMAEASLAEGIFPSTLAVMGKLRAKNGPIANKLFTDALASAKLRRGIDVNELLLLYAYVFSPLRVPVVTPQGLGMFNIPAYNDVAQDYSVDPVLARVYLETAGQIVLDENRLDAQNLPLLKNGIEGDYYLIRFIQPVATQYAPALASALAFRNSVLAAMLQQDRRESADAGSERWKKAPDSANSTGPGNANSVDYFIERAEATSDPVRRDRLYYQAASKAVQIKEYERAFKIVDKLTGPYADEAKQLIAFDVALSAARNKDVDQAEFFARRDNDLVQRAFVFTIIAAGLLEEKTSGAKRARQFLEEVAQLTTRLNKENERAAVLFGLVSVYSRFDIGEATQTLTMAIQAANRLEEFGRNPAIRRGLNIGGFLFDYSMYGAEFTFTEGIKTLAAKDFDGTLSQIQVLKSRVPRLSATVLICATVLAKPA